MQLPKKGEIVPLKKVKELCIYFELFDLWDKIENDPPIKPFKSDGCSGGWPDMWKDKNGKKVSLYRACLIHDLQYWAGYKNEDMLRFMADTKLMIDVAQKTKRLKLALTMFIGVRTGGVGWAPFPFRWGFGRQYGR